MLDPTDSTPDQMNHGMSGLRPGWEEKEKDVEKEKNYSFVSVEEFKTLKRRCFSENARTRSVGIYIPQVTSAPTLLPSERTTRGKRACLNPDCL